MIRADSQPLPDNAAEDARMADPIDTLATVTDLWTGFGLPAEALRHLVLTGSAPALPSSFAVSVAAQAGIALAALAAAEYWHLRTGRRQQVAVDLRHAAIECRSDHYFTIDGHAIEFSDPLTGLYRCGDDRWVRIHANFAHHRDGALALLKSAASRADITTALGRYGALAFEQSAAAVGLPVVAMRSTGQWEEHPQGKALALMPVMSITRIGDGPAVALRRAAREGAGRTAGAPLVPPVPPVPRSTAPLAGVRVLELTRILAGPVCGRTLAAYGAEVLLVNSPHLPNIDAIADTGRGKLSTHVDLRTAEGCLQLHRLLETADVFLQGYRPGSLAGLGFGPGTLAERYPGIVQASLSAYGPDGPWRLRRGFDSLVQTAAGFNLDEAEAAGSPTPKPLPTQILDHASGYLLAFGIQAALVRRAIEGGSWHVQVSLAQTARWLRAMGRIPDGFAVRDPGREDVRDLLQTTPSGFGALTAVRHAAQFSETPAGWKRPSVPLGTHPAAWPAV